ncbi:MAG: MerR family transcriptional regulator [Calditrichaeota bacterium]|nr:MerR family transcriptional regulator [Calditrichota bacterium]MCB9366010.1 MerR family transcriptional regulator [Calditrichota bacterium]MCB9391864.1 MerR family transcriptional regulator [Calditrichota bacterium]
MKTEEMITLPRARSSRGPKLYSIGQVHAITGIPKPTIRYWEKEFEEFLEPQRTTGNQRRYDEKSIADLEKINYLVKVQGYTLEGAKRKLEMLRRSDIERPQSNDPIAELARAMSDYLMKKSPRD